jgi:hypothetical protein
MNLYSDFAVMALGSFIGNYVSNLFYKNKGKVTLKAFQLRLDLSEPDKNTYYSIQDAVKSHSYIEINLVCGTCPVNPDFALNWYYSLMERPKNCHVTIRLNSNIREGGMAIALACDQIIPRYGSWYEITSIEKATEDEVETDFGYRHRKSSSFSNLKLLHRVLGQYLEIPSCFDKKIPLSSLTELGLPVLEVSKDSYRTPIEVG